MDDQIWIPGSRVLLVKFRDKYQDVSVLMVSGSVPGYLSVAVDAAMTLETSELVCTNDGVEMCRHSTAILLSAVLSSTTTASAFSVRRLSVSSEL